MANNYLQFSVELKIDPQHQEKIKQIITNQPNGDDWPCEVSFEICNERKSIILYAEEYGNPEQAADLIYQLIQKELVKYSKYILLTWAETCSKPRPDEFCGGAFMIHKDGIEWMPPPSIWAESCYLEKSNG